MSIWKPLLAFFLIDEFFDCDCEDVIDDADDIDDYEECDDFDDLDDNF